MKKYTVLFILGSASSFDITHPFYISLKNVRGELKESIIPSNFSPIIVLLNGYRDTSFAYKVSGFLGARDVILPKKSNVTPEEFFEHDVTVVTKCLQEYDHVVVCIADCPMEYFENFARRLNVDVKIFTEKPDGTWIFIPFLKINDVSASSGSNAAI